MIERAASWVWRLMDDPLFNLGMSLLFAGMSLLDTGKVTLFYAFLSGLTFCDASWRRQK